MACETAATYISVGIDQLVETVGLTVVYHARGAEVYDPATGTFQFSGAGDHNVAGFFDSITATAPDGAPTIAITFTVPSGLSFVPSTGDTITAVRDGVSLIYRVTAVDFLGPGDTSSGYTLVLKGK